MGRVWFTSDLHLGHEAAANFRGFDECWEHDEVVVDSLAKLVCSRDLLWILGDVAWEPKDLQHLHRIPGTKRLIIGNHDKADTGLYLKYFESVHGFLKYKKMWLSHCPIHPQELYRCQANVHGHIHKDAQTPELPFPYINVNWDFWRQPLTLEQLRSVIEENTAD